MESSCADAKKDENVHNYELVITSHNLVVKGRKGCILAMTRRTSGMRTASSATRSVGKNDSIHG